MVRLIRQYLSRAWMYARRGDWSLATVLAHPVVLGNHLLHRWQLSRRQTWLVARPTDLNLEATNLCNQNCIQCYRHQVKPFNPGRLSFPDFRRIVDQFPYLTSLSLTGFGEPLLNKELPEMVRYARRGRPYLRVLIYSNGEFLEPGTCEALVRAGLTRLSVSVDAATRESFERIRLQGKWDRVTGGVRNMVEARRRLSSRTPRIGMSYSVMAENAGELPEFVKLVAGLGCDQIGPVRLVSSKWGYRPVVHRGKLADEIRRAQEALATTDLDVYGFPSPGDIDPWLAVQFNDSNAAGEFGCPINWSLDPTVHVAWDGHVLLCCERPYPEEVNLGNLLVTPLAEMWNSPLIRETRRRFYVREQPSAACKGCVWLERKDMVLLDGHAQGVVPRVDPTPSSWVRVQLDPRKRERSERSSGPAGTDHRDGPAQPAQAAAAKAAAVAATPLE
jgi:MoaA/NifB/PqqE/SkfB family radical SAM enzyme